MLMEVQQDFFSFIVIRRLDRLPGVGVFCGLFLP
jgi:hypothetical protein